MAEKTSIEWTDSTWSPIRARRKTLDAFGKGAIKTGWHCEHVSEGCRNCYAEGINRRLGTGLDFKPGHRADVEIFLDEKMLLAPLRWKKPRRIFVNSMSDTFGEFVKDEWIDRVFAVMALAPRHTFQVLTKRAGRMASYFKEAEDESEFGLGARWCRATYSILNDLPGDAPDLPLPNVWLGVSAEDQATFEERRQPLRDTPAAVRFFSLEPLLSPIDASAAIATDCYHLVIIGGESGPHARPFNLAWARKLVSQCKSASVPVFVKQMGSRPVITVRDENCTAQDSAHDVYLTAKDRKGGDWNEWPEDLRVRELPVLTP